MKKTIIATILGMMLLAANAMATVVYYPEISFGFWAQQANYTWNGEIGTLNVNGFVETVQFTKSGAAVPVYSLTTPPMKNEAPAIFQAIFDPNNGGYIDSEGIWHFSMLSSGIDIQGTVTAPDGTPYGSSELPLLTGVFDSLWVNPNGGTKAAPAWGGMIDVTGGDLQPFFADGKGTFSVACVDYQQAPGTDPTSYTEGWQTCTSAGRVNPVPEPASMLLLGSGLLGFLGLKRRKSTM